MLNCRAQEVSMEIFAAMGCVVLAQKEQRLSTMSALRAGFSWLFVACIESMRSVSKAPNRCVLYCALRDALRASRLFGVRV